MATFNKVNDFVANAVHNMDLESDQIVVALSNTAPGSETPNPASDGNGVLANVTQITYTNLSSRNVTIHFSPALMLIPFLRYTSLPITSLKVLRSE